MPKYLVTGVIDGGLGRDRRQELFDDIVEWDGATAEQVEAYKADRLAAARKAARQNWGTPVDKVMLTNVVRLDTPACDRRRLVVCMGVRDGAPCVGSALLVGGESSLPDLLERVGAVVAPEDAAKDITILNILEVT